MKYLTYTKYWIVDNNGHLSPRKPPEKALLETSDYKTAVTLEKAMKRKTDKTVVFAMYGQEGYHKSWWRVKVPELSNNLRYVAGYPGWKTYEVKCFADLKSACEFMKREDDRFEEEFGTKFSQDHCRVFLEII